MNILVLIKQVPQTEAATEINPAGSYIERSPVAVYKMNRFDEYALEEALRIKESCPGTRVDVITLGPEQARDVIRRAYGMGADNGIHIFVDDSGYLDPSAVAARIGEAAAQGNYDLIFAGIMSEDMMQCQTGQMVAEFLGLPSFRRWWLLNWIKAPKKFWSSGNLKAASVIPSKRICLW